MLIHVLGPVEVRTADGWQRLGAPKWRAVIARLTLSVGSPVSVDALVDELWPERPPAGAVNQVHGYVSRLRSLLGDRERTVLVTRSPGYELVIGDQDLDSSRFERLTDSAEQALRDGDHQNAAELFSDALQLWRGPAYADVPSSEGIRIEVDRLTERRLRAQEGRIDADLGSGRPAAELITELQASVSANPLREHLWEQLMLALYRADRQSDALLAYQEAYRRLDSELGVQPGAALNRLQERILARDPDLDAGEDTGPAVTTRTAPPEPASVPRQLAADIPDFIGRQQELAALDDWLAAADSDPAEAPPALALSGGGGSGKTTLAVHWAYRVADRFPDGQLYVNLRGFATDDALPAQQALAAFLRGLGVPPGQLPVDPAELAALFRTRLSDRRMLIVLDNALDDHQVLPLLPGAGSNRVLVTSRDPLSGLATRGLARQLRLGELSAGETELLLTRIIGRPRLAAEPTAASRLARLCGGLPLAARITAAHLAGNPGLPVADHVTELADGSAPRLAALDLDPDHADDPSASVRAAFDLSFARLGPSSQRLFLLLSLAPGDSFSASAAAALIDHDLPATRTILDQLCARGMLGFTGPRRYALHDLLKAYATERRSGSIDRDDERAAVRRLFCWYAGTAARAVAASVPPLISQLPDPAPVAVPATIVDDQETAAKWLETERSQLLALATTAADDPDRPVWQLSDVLRPYFFHRAYPGDWLALAHAGLASARTAGYPTGESAAELSLAQAYRRISAYREAAGHADRALVLAEESGWTAGAGSIWNELAVLRLEQGDVRSAPALLKRAIDLFSDLGNHVAQAMLMINLGHATRQLGDLAEACRQLTGALQLLPDETTAGIGIIHAALSDNYRLMGRLDQAAAELDQAEAALQQTLQGRASYLANRCEQKMANQDFGGALDDAEQALALSRKHRSVRLEAVSLLERAEVRIAAGFPAEAIGDATAAEKLARESDAGYEWVQSLSIVARAQVRAGQAEEGRQTATRAVAESQRYGYRIEMASAESVLAEAELRLGHPAQARVHARRALGLYRETGCRLREQQLAELIAGA